MLELLVLRKGTVISKDAFLNHLYGGMDEPEMKIVDVFICKLRKNPAQLRPDAVQCHLVAARTFARTFATRSSRAPKHPSSR